MKIQKKIVGLVSLLCVISILSCEVAEKAAEVVEAAGNVIDGITDATETYVDLADAAIASLSDPEDGEDTVVPQIDEEYTGSVKYESTATGQSGQFSALDNQKLREEDPALSEKNYPKKDDGSIDDSDAALDQAVADEDITEADKAKIKSAKKKSNKAAVASMTQHYSQSINSLLFSYLFTKIIKDNKGVPLASKYTVKLNNDFYTGFKNFYTKSTGQESLPHDIEGKEVISLFGQGEFSAAMMQQCGTTCLSITLTDLMQVDTTGTNSDLKDKDNSATFLYDMKISAQISMPAVTIAGHSFEIAGGAGYIAAIYLKFGSVVDGKKPIDKFKYVFVSPMTKLHDYAEVLIHDIKNGHFTLTEQKVSSLVESSATNEDGTLDTAFNDAYDLGLFDKTKGSNITTPEGITVKAYPVLEVNKAAFKRTVENLYTFISSTSLYGILKLADGVVKTANGNYDDDGGVDSADEQHRFISSNTAIGKIAKGAAGVFASEYKVRELDQLSSSATYLKVTTPRSEKRNIALDAAADPVEFADDDTDADKKAVVDLRKGDADKDDIETPSEEFEKDYDHDKMKNKGKVEDDTDTRKHKEEKPTAAPDMSSDNKKPILEVVTSVDDKAAIITLVVGHKFDLAKSNGKILAANFVLTKGTVAEAIVKVKRVKNANDKYALEITATKPAAVRDVYSLTIKAGALIFSGGHTNEKIVIVGIAQ